MKKLIVAMAIAFVASTASATIKNSSHDLTTAGGGSTCAYCHMPHNSPSTVTGAPLWARNITYTGNYTTYVSGVTGATVAGAPNAGSRVCLSCHDGSQALSQVFNADGTGTQNAGTAAIGTMTGARVVGSDLRNDHPVSMVYNTSTTFGIAGAPPAEFNIPTPGTSTVECTSCHNAHNGINSASAYPNRQFMVAYTGDFCGACHSTK